MFIIFCSTECVLFLAEFHSSKSLNARDCLFLGKHAFNRGYYDKAIEWFQVAQDMAKQDEDSSAPKEEIEPFLTAAVRVVSSVHILRYYLRTV